MPTVIAGARAAQSDDGLRAGGRLPRSAMRWRCSAVSDGARSAIIAWTLPLIAALAPSRS
jgi:hypothetical protein